MSPHIRSQKFLEESVWLWTGVLPQPFGLGSQGMAIEYLIESKQEPMTVLTSKRFRMICDISYKDH